MAAMLMAALAACSSVPVSAPGPSPSPRFTPTHPGALWVKSEWSTLPGWSDEALGTSWPLLMQGCQHPPPAWEHTCSQAQHLAPSSLTAIRQWFESELQPFRVCNGQGDDQGLLTGYFEPMIDAKRQPDAQYGVPLLGVPRDLKTRVPYWSRDQMSTLEAARASLQGAPIAYVRDPLDALLIQIQGSARLRLLDEHGAQGGARVVRLAYAGNNGWPYQSVGKWLIQQGELRADQANWPAIKAWVREHPQREAELLRVNPRVVFFKEQAVGAEDAMSAGPVGALGLPLTAEHSIAVDVRSVPLGTPVWIASTVPRAWDDPSSVFVPSQALQQLVWAQDTGAAITGAVRADYFWGTGEHAELQAGRTRQPLRMWVLWPRDALPAP